LPDFFLDSIDSFLSSTGSFVHPEFTQFVRRSDLRSVRLSPSSLCREAGLAANPLARFVHPSIHPMPSSSYRYTQALRPSISPFLYPHIQLIASLISRSLNLFIGPSIIQSAHLFFLSINPTI
jgi:hypothetical protein